MQSFHGIHVFIPQIGFLAAINTFYPNKKKLTVGEPNPILMFVWVACLPFRDNAGAHCFVLGFSFNSLVFPWHHSQPWDRTLLPRAAWLWSKVIFYLQALLPSRNPISHKWQCKESDFFPSVHIGQNYLYDRETEESAGISQTPKSITGLTVSEITSPFCIHW